MRLFGREAEIRAFDQILNDCVLGQGAFILVSGEPGIGKTALLANVAASAEAAGIRVLADVYSPSRPPASGNPLIDIMRSSRRQARFESSRAEGQLNGSGSSTNGHCLRGGDPGLSASPVKPDPDRGQDLRSLLLEAGGSQPLLILMDDFRGFGEKLPQMVTCLAAALRDLPVLILAACRPPSAGYDACQALIETAACRVRNFDLKPLSDRAIGELLESQLSRQLNPGFLEWSCELTGGNPRLLAESGPLFISADAEITDSRMVPIAIPPGVRIAVEERLEELPPRARQLLRSASVFGSAFEPELVVWSAEADLGESWAAFIQLENERLVKPGDGRQYQFAHGFVREVLYQSIPQELRSSMHRRIAMALEGRHANDLASHAELIARHLLWSRETSALATAIRHARMASQRLMQSGEFARASEMLDLTYKQLRGAEYEDDAALCDVLTDWGIAQKKAGHLAAAEETFRQATKYARRMSNSRRLTRLALEVPDYHWPLPGAGSPLAILLIENALQPLGQKENESRALLTARLAAELSYDRTQKQRAEELAMLAFEIAAKADNDSQLMLQVYRFRDCSLRHPDKIEQRLANLTHLTSLAKQLGDMAVLWEATIASICADLTLGKIDEAERLLPVLEQASELANSPLYRIFTLVSLAGRAASRQRLGDRERLFEEIKRAADKAGLPAVVNRCWPIMIAPLIERGGLSELETMAEQAVRDRPTSVIDRAMKCWLDARLGRRFEATLILERFAISDFAELRHSADFLAGAAALGDACIQLGDVQHHARRIYELLEPYANLEIMLGQISGQGAVAYQLGRLAKTLSDNEPALQHFKTAVGLHFRAATTSLSLYAAFDLAAVLSEGGADGAKASAASTLLKAIRSEAANHEMNRLAEYAPEWRSGHAAEARLDNVFLSNIVRSDRPARTNGDCDHPAEAATAPTLPDKCSFIFRRESDYWLLGYEERLSRVRHRKGLALISRLLHKPHEAIHVIELARIAGQHNSEAELQMLKTPDMGPVLDSAAKDSYRQRARELRADLEEARQFNDLGRVSKIEEELQFLTRELAKAIDLFGRDRTRGSSNERARLRVTNAIKYAIAGIITEHQPLAQHLTKTIKTGFYCAYRPDVRLDWML